MGDGGRFVRRRARIRGALALSIAIPLLVLTSACDDTECGPGTVRAGDQCVPASSGEDYSDCVCGPGTHLDLTMGGCAPDTVQTWCSDNTVGVTNDAGVTVCYGAAPLPSRTARGSASQRLGGAER